MGSFTNRKATNTGDLLSGVVVNSFAPVLLNGTSLTPPNLTTATILSVYEQGNPANTTNRAGNPYMSRFAAPSNGNGSFNLVVIDDSELVVDTGNNDLTFQIEFNHPSAVSSFTALLDVTLDNVAPVIDGGTCPVIAPITEKTNIIYDFTGVNGSFTSSLDQLDLTWSLTGSTDTSKFEIGNVVSANPLLNNWGQLRATSLQTAEGTYPIQVTLTDGGGFTDVCDLSVTYSYTPTATFTPNGNQSVNVNNTDYPGGGNISPVIQTGTLTIANSGAAGFNVFMRSQHQGATSSAWTTSFNATVGVNSFNDGILATSSPYTTDTLPTNLADGTYSFSVKIDVLDLPPLSSGTAQSLCTLIAEVP